MIEFSFSYLTIILVVSIILVSFLFRNIISFVLISEILGVSIVPFLSPAVIITQYPQGFLLISITFLVAAVELIVPALFLRIFSIK